MNLWTMILVITGLLTSSSLGKDDKCEELRNGRYQVKFDSRFSVYKDYEINIVKNKYLKRTTDDSKEIEGVIERHSECVFILEDIIPKADTVTETELSKLMKKSFGRECIEILKISRDSAYFRTTYTSDLHVTINEGVFIKVKTDKK